MKSLKPKFIFLATLSICLSSCSTSLLYTSLDVLRPAKVAFANDANDLLIVNNTVNQPSDYGHKTEILYSKPKNINIQTDSLPIFCVGALTEDLEGKGFFSSVRLIPNSLNDGSDFFKPGELTDDNVKKLCLANHSNVILSLDRIVENDDLIEDFMVESNTFLASIEARFETYWSIHYLNNPEVTTMQYKDTLYWQSESYERAKAQSDLPKRTDALIDGALNIGHICVNRFVPYWDKVDRYFFNPNNKLMKQGMDSVYVKNWKSAINSWDSVYVKSHNVRIQAEAANNIAIGWEITGNIDKALDYATKSYNSFGKLTIVDYESYFRLSEYIKELTERKKEIDILRKQLGE
ncbi:MAG: DUF6340 family protein [Paludibacter sp.]|nr:DUF6340 family protein [Paludibacter sp.]